MSWKNFRIACNVQNKLKIRSPRKNNYPCPSMRSFCFPTEVSDMARNVKIELLTFSPIPQGPAVIFSHHQVCIKKKKGDTFWGAKSESRVSAPFFASKTV